MGFERINVGKGFSLMKKPVSPPPPHLFWTCPTCGPIEPFLKPTGKYIKRSCACQRREADERQRKELHDDMVRAILRMCFAKDLTLKQKTFENYNPALQPQLEHQKMLKRRKAKCFTYANECIEVLKARQKSFLHEDMVEETARFLLLSGDCGLGKTHLLAAICHFLAEQGIRSMFLAVPDMFTEYYHLLSLNNGEAHAFLQKLLHIPFLVLDDLDKMDGNDFRKGFFFQIINGRMNKGLPTAFSTNAEGLGSYMGDASISRLTQNILALELQGEDMRPLLQQK